MRIVGRAVPRATRGRNGGSAYTRRHARTRDRRRRIHRLEPRRRAARAGPRGPRRRRSLHRKARATSTDALAAGATLHRGGHPRRRRDARAPRERAPEVVFHLAAQIDVRVSVTRPGLRRARSNVEARSTCSRRRRVHGVRRFVFASTGGAIYGETDVMPTPEGTEPRPMAPYGTSKLLRRAVPRALPAPARHVDRRAALRQRLRAPPGPARRGGRHRDLLRRGCATASARGSSATASRPATTSTSATSSRRSPPRARATPRARSTSAPRRRPPCCASPSCCSRTRARPRRSTSSPAVWARSSARSCTPDGPEAPRLERRDADRRGPAADLGGVGRRLSGCASGSTPPRSS